MVNVTQRDVRSTGFMHRANVTDPDVILITPTIPIVIETQAVYGQLTPGAYNMGYVARIKGMGVTNRSSVNVITVPIGSLTNTVSMVIPQKVGATHYEAFFSPYVNSGDLPLWICSITEEQRVNGAFVTAPGVVSSPSIYAAPGRLVFNCIGTGISIGSSIFDWSNAFILPTPDNIIDCVGKTRADLYVLFELDDLRENPYFLAVPFYKTQAPDSKFYSGPTLEVNNYDMVGEAVVNECSSFDVSSCEELLIAVGGLQGKGATVDIWVELV